MEQVTVQTAEEDEEAADAAAAGRGEGEAGKGAGDCPPVPQISLGISRLATSLPLLGCLSVILQSDVSLQLHPRDKGKVQENI